MHWAQRRQSVRGLLTVAASNDAAGFYQDLAQSPVVGRASTFAVGMRERARFIFHRWSEFGSSGRITPAL
jgi:hypothetical protein